MTTPIRPERMTWPPRSIIVPVGLAAHSERLVSVAAGLAAGLGAELILAGIAPLAPARGAAAQARDLTPLPSNDEQRLMDLLVGERLEELSDGLPDGVRFRVLLTWGSLPVALVAAARDEHAELIVVGMRRGRAIGHALHDHADRHVLHHSEVPVLVVPIESPRARLG
jgi:nucleotide-binding universal stress UspA family protein